MTRRAELPDERETYVVESAADCAYLGRWTGLTVNALTHRVTASFEPTSGEGVVHVVLGEPLCVGCDAPIADGPCGCMRRAG
jgi:hypothetical protein